MTNNMMNETRTVVIGDGWAALGTVGLLGSAGVEVLWIPGVKPRFIAPLPVFNEGIGFSTWMDLLRQLGLETGNTKCGDFLREFRNKAFRPARQDSLWDPEKIFILANEHHCFESGPLEIDESVRAAIAKLKNVSCLTGAEVKEFALEKNKVSGLVIESGKVIKADIVFYAARGGAISGLDGFRHRDPLAALQVTFIHETCVGADLEEGFLTAIPKDNGEERDRHVFGYFSNDGQRSVWTLLLTSDETEDNHKITKKLRRMKQAFGRMFSGAEIKSEQVRLIENAVFTKGNPPDQPVTLSRAKGIFFLTDGYGSCSAMQQVSMALAGDRLPVLKDGSQPQAEHMNI